MADYGINAAIAAAKASKGQTPRASAPVEAKANIPLSSILDRPGGDTRPLNELHVKELSESITAVGLIQPIAVDRNGHLLAGGHRRAALQLLQTEKPDSFAKLFPSGIPVRAMDIDATQEAETAIAIEAAENEKRRDYTPAEVRALADRLVEAGYSYAVKGGRSRKGRKALKPTLAMIVGKSEKTIQRYLSPKKKTRTDVQVSPENRLIKELEKFELTTEDETAAALAAQLRERLQ